MSKVPDSPNPWCRVCGERGMLYKQNGIKICGKCYQKWRDCGGKHVWSETYMGLCHQIMRPFPVMPYKDTPKITLESEEFNPKFRS